MILDDERGFATVWAVMAASVILVIGVVGVDLASAVRARHQAAVAADLAALAAAGRSVDGVDPACDAARSVAEHNGTTMRGCRLDGWDALVQVEAGRRWTLLGHGPAGAEARAGPAPADTGTAPPTTAPPRATTAHHGDPTT